MRYVHVHVHNNYGHFLFCHTGHLFLKDVNFNCAFPPFAAKKMKKELNIQNVYTLVGYLYRYAIDTLVNVVLTVSDIHS